MFVTGAAYGSAVMSAPKPVPSQARQSAARSGQGSGYDMLAVWRDHADNVTGQAIASGHFLPEEAPDETYRALRAFFA